MIAREQKPEQEIVPNPVKKMMMMMMKGLKHGLMFIRIDTI